jgi:hypothetical protein
MTLGWILQRAWVCNEQGAGERGGRECAQEDARAAVGQGIYIYIRTTLPLSAVLLITYTAHSHCVSTEWSHLKHMQGHGQTSSNDGTNHSSVYAWNIQSPKCLQMVVDL